MSDKLDTRVIQVTNIAPSCSKEQLRTLFGYLGRIKELHMYPPDNAEGVVTARVAYLEFEDSVTTGVALHLSSTVFIDRAIMIVPVMDGKIPDESTALQLTPSAVAGMLPGQPTWPANVVSQVTGLGANQIIMTNDPRLTSLGLPQYPPLPATTDPSKIEEIRRTVYVSDLDPKVTPEMLLTFFSQTGEIKYIRMAGDESGTTRSAYIEFTDQRCIAQALSYNNVVFQGRTVSVKHATTSIVKPTAKSEASQREIDEAMKKVNEASKLISAAANSDREKSGTPPKKRSRSKSKARSRSRSKSRRSRSRSRGRRRRSRSRSRKRSRSRRRSPRRSRTPVRRRGSRTRGRVAPSAPPIRRSRSRDRRRSRTRSPVRRKRSRSASRTKRKSRTPPKSYSRSSPTRNRRSRSRSRKRSRSRDRERKEKNRDRKKSPSISPPRLERDGSLSHRDEKESSPARDGSLEQLNQEKNKDVLREQIRRHELFKKRSMSPPKARKRSPTPKKRSRSRSLNRRKKSRRRSKSPSPRKRSRSRSGSRHKSKKDRKRSRSRDRKHDSKKKISRDKDERKKDSGSKVKRDYDEEEKGYASEASDDRENSEDRDSSSPPTLLLAAQDKDIDHQTVDMDMSD